MGKTAIILGATGLTGSLLLQKLLQDEKYSCIKLFSRRSIGFQHPKLTEYIGDVVQLEKFDKDFTADEVFCCIGTTKAKTKDPETYKAIDFGIPVKAAKLAKKNSISFFAVISALGANSNSAIFYNRTKGEMEEVVLAQKITHTYILRPSLINGTRTEKRFGEDIANRVFQVFNLLLVGRLKKYQSIKATTIATALWKIAQIKSAKQYITSDEIKSFAVV